MPNIESKLNNRSKPDIRSHNKFREKHSSGELVTIRSSKWTPQLTYTIQCSTNSTVIKSDKKPNIVNHEREIVQSRRITNINTNDTQLRCEREQEKEHRLRDQGFVFILYTSSSAVLIVQVIKLVSHLSSWCWALIYDILLLELHRHWTYSYNDLRLKWYISQNVRDKQGNKTKTIGLQSHWKDKISQWTWFSWGPVHVEISNSQAFRDSKSIKRANDHEQRTIFRR